jgi:acetyl/propionyl-CoA carboxylase alpha subunit/acetyl-CoA carboxylase carboxyltransferase component
MPARRLPAASRRAGVLSILAVLPTRLLIANRGEIAIRIARAAAELEIPTVAVFSTDDAGSLHARRAADARSLAASGPAAYLDQAGLIAVAGEAACDALHPGYGFLSENAAFARRCAEAGLCFVGPRPEVLELFGDKARARALAVRCGVPVLAGTSVVEAADDVRAFLASLGAGGVAVLKAVAGGGGRGMRVVRHADEVDDAWARCRSEALQAFGSADLYVERLLPRARHVEVQVVGDRSGAVTHLWERECTLQRRHQKLVELAPSPDLPAALRARLLDAALRMAAEVRFDNLGTFEFLIDATDVRDDTPFAFIEANPRLQVEHTVTEEITGVDLVQLQLRLAGGASLAELDLPASPPRGVAVQVRINAERIGTDGSVRPSGGVVTAFELPSGPGIRVDSAGHAGYRTNPRFDPLLAKLVAHVTSAGAAAALAKAARALDELVIAGVPTNVPFLRRLLRHPAVVANDVSTRFVEDHLDELAADGDASGTPAAGAVLAGARVDATDPLAILAHGKSGMSATLEDELATAPEGTVAITAPMQGSVVSIAVGEGEPMYVGQAVLVMEAMKMEHVIESSVGGVVRQVLISVGDAVFEGSPLVLVEEGDVGATASSVAEEADLDAIRADLDEVRRRQSLTHDGDRPDAVARRRATGQRTARENVDDLCDPGSFVEYGSLAIAAQRRRRPVQELIERTPADGLVAGIGRINGALVGDARARCVVMSYDYTVLAGTQGLQNHRKKDRMFELAEEWRLPVAIFAEGGGGRPGDTDASAVAGLDTMAFHLFGRLSGLVPLVGIVSGRCFAGNAALLGCCDVVIASRDANIGMGGPAMIEGGGLGVFRPEEIGPASVQAPNGVIDVLVDDEAEAVRVAKRYLSYFQGPLDGWTCADQRRLRRLVPENRLRAYDVRAVIETLADADAVLELRRHFGRGMVTALIRIEGRPLGLIANNPMHLGGAIDSDGADKAARFLQLCDAFDIPVLMLCDTPGMMVGPEVEKTALVRHCCRLFVIGASVTIPIFTIVLRKGYGLGAQAMAGGSFKAPVFTVSWPTGEFGGMGLEGSVKLGYRNELAAIADPAARRAAFEEMVARAYEHGKALNMASVFEIDDVIDPADSRARIMGALRAMPASAPRREKKRPCVDPW